MSLQEVNISLPQMAASRTFAIFGITCLYSLDYTDENSEKKNDTKKKVQPVGYETSEPGDIHEEPVLAL
jgi:hypothetical protein